MLIVKLLDWIIEKLDRFIPDDPDYEDDVIEKLYNAKVQREAMEKLIKEMKE